MCARCLGTCLTGLVGVSAVLSVLLVQSREEIDGCGACVILAPDRVGLVSEVADHLFEACVNLGDTTFAVLGTGAEFTVV